MRKAKTQTKEAIMKCRFAEIGRVDRVLLGGAVVLLREYQNFEGNIEGGRGRLEGWVEGVVLLAGSGRDTWLP